MPEPQSDSAGNVYSAHGCVSVARVRTPQSRRQRLKRARTVCYPCKCGFEYRNYEQSLDKMWQPASIVDARIGIAYPKRAMKSFRKAVSLVLLLVVGTPASLGVALHRLETACVGEQTAVASCSCCTSPSEDATSPEESNEQIAADGVCLLCDYLATAKPAAQPVMPILTLDLLPTRSSAALVPLDINTIPSSVWARGPPATAVV